MSHPWQERESRGYVRAFLATVWAVLRSPRAFFAETSGSRGLGGPLVFGVAAGALGEVLQFLVVTPIAALAARLFDLPAALKAPTLVVRGFDLFTLPGWTLSLLGCQAAFLAVPLIFVMYAVFLFCLSGLAHLALRLLGGLRHSSEGFAGTFAVACYAMAAFPAQMIPALGDATFAVLVLVLLTIGLTTVHKTTRATALVATLVATGLLIAFVVLALLQLPGPTPG